MSSSVEGEIDRILGGADFEELETMNVSPQEPEGSQDILGVVPALTPHRRRKMLKAGGHTK